MSASGKTLVAFLALLIAVEAGGQGVMMAPTEILARQHFEGLAPLAAAAGVRLELLTGPRQGGGAGGEAGGSGRRGEIAILVGTHAVFQKDVQFHDLRLAVVDEQHRFGVAQRMELGAKGAAADVLVMTATPIPRSPGAGQLWRHGCVGAGREAGGAQADPHRAGLGRPDGRGGRPSAQAVAEGRQAYWVCPLVEDSEVVDYAAPRRGSSTCAPPWARRGRAGARPDAARREGRRDGALRRRARPRCWWRPR